jgi:methylated-DNA-[protein]-cysteine S-methyltransferase
METNAYVYDTKIGKIGITESGGNITGVYFDYTTIPEDFVREETSLLEKASKQLNEYLDGKRTVFDLPLKPEGTAFEKSCWNALLAIPYGETRTYGEQAKAVGNPKASRAVGRANSMNPISIFIPCHRVIGANGSLTGFGGGLDMKKTLLELEKKTILQKGLASDLFSE